MYIEAIVLSEPVNTQLYLTPRGHAPNSLKSMKKPRNQYFSLKYNGFGLKYNESETHPPTPRGGIG